MLPVLMGTAIPLVICIAIAFVLRPKGELEMPKYMHNQTFQTHTYVSTTWGQEKIKPYRVTPREDPADPTPIYNELESLMRESEARLDSAVKAANILHELKLKAKGELQPV